MFSWFKHEDVVLDKSVTDAPALSLSIEQAGGRFRRRVPGEHRSKGAAVPSTVPDPPAPAVGALSKVVVCSGCLRGDGVRRLARPSGRCRQRPVTVVSTSPARKSRLAPVG